MPKAISVQIISPTLGRDEEVAAALLGGASAVAAVLRQVRASRS